MWGEASHIFTLANTQVTVKKTAGLCCVIANALDRLGGEIAIVGAVGVLGRIRELVQNESWLTS